MRIGVHVPDFTYPGGAATLGADLARIAETADAAGIDRLSVMDHLWQIRVVGPVEHDMLEAYTVLGFLAAHSSRVKLLTLVTGVTYRDPGLLAKAVTTLDVLSGGRAMLGIGAAWNEEESRGLGLLFPPTAERFERLEEALQICLQMWSGRPNRTTGSTTTWSAPSTCRRCSRARTRRSSSGAVASGRRCAWSRSTPTRATCSRTPDLPRKLEVLRQHCADVGRDYDEIEKTVLYNFDLGPDGEHVDETLQRLRELSDLGFSVAHGRVADVHDPKHLELIGERIVPVVADW